DKLVTGVQTCALPICDPGPGYETFGGVGFTPSGGLGGWAPGAAPPLLPAGVARIVPGNCELIIQMHYHPDGHERIDQSSVAIYQIGRASCRERGYTPG